ncbi:TorD/DmsD family molecular chaperone [Senegalimassilia anaerobia]|uniref:TorD/DmsD family molecular chaperone n=1 Tax=Senegalimassilia anaerobia TaxID=1473216 RepID=UPI003A8F5784
MRSMTGEEWMVASQLYAFLGNSLLSPMSRTESVGLDPAFWRELGGLLDGALTDSAESLASWAERASADAARSEVVQRVSVEFTKLFVGPPKPAAAPWESANGPVDSHVGFGEATFAMRERLRALGLELCNENNQYEDHVGIELLYLSELCRRASEEASGAACDAAAPDAEEIASFIREHPLAWVPRLREKVAASQPEGYFIRLLDVVLALLKWQA